MGYPRRWFQPNVMYEITTRTVQERFLLRPSAEGRALILGVIARAQALYPSIRIFAFVFLSNHYHMLLDSQRGAEISKFIGYINSNIAREMGRLHRWRGPFWMRRYRAIPILDDEAVLVRLRYVLSHGVKEGLVSSPRMWPGASAVPGLLGAMSLAGRWIARDGLRRARRHSRTADASQFTSVSDVTLSPLPMWNHLSSEALRAKYATMVDDIEREGAAKRGRRFVGIAKVLAQDTHAQPSQVSSSPAPQCHTSSPIARRAYRVAYAAFVAAFRAATATVRDTAEATCKAFPRGSFPRPPWFLPERGTSTIRKLMADLTLEPSRGITMSTG
jgi:REP element-mobilizing transposase RayT